MSRLSMSRPAPSVPKTWVQVPLLKTGGCRRLDRFVSIGSNGAITSAKNGCRHENPEHDQGKRQAAQYATGKAISPTAPTEGGSMALSRLGDVIAYPRIDVGV